MCIFNLLDRGPLANLSIKGFVFHSRRLLATVSYSGCLVLDTLRKCLFFVEAGPLGGFQGGGGLKGGRGV